MTEAFVQSRPFAAAWRVSLLYVALTLMSATTIACESRHDARFQRGPSCPDVDASGKYAGEPLIVFHAGSLARPLHAALDSFTTRCGVPVVTLSAGSLEAARRIIDLHDVPDIIALADEEVFPSLLMPAYVTSYSTFARNRMVIARARGRPRGALDSTNWYRVLIQPGVEVGRSDPDLDPAGYRTLMVLRLAEHAYHDPGIESAILVRSPPRNVRPKSADLTALLEVGAIDYAFVYESVARSARLSWAPLPAAINLGEDSLADAYARVSVRIAGGDRGDSITIRGAPIRYALAVPRGAPHPSAALQLQRFLLTSEGATAMLAAGLDVVRPVTVSTPPIVRLLSPRTP
jgi:molybdate/tungstate transport system substrate-binding protein